MWVQHWFIPWHMVTQTWFDLDWSTSQIVHCWCGLNWTATGTHTYACTLFVQILRSTFVSFTVIVSWPFWTHARFALAIHLRFSSSILLGQDQQRGVLRKKGSHTWYPYRFGWVMRKKAKTGSGSTFFSACVLVTDLIDHSKESCCLCYLSWWKKQLRSSQSKSLFFFWCQLEDVIIEVRWCFISIVLYSAAMYETCFFEYSNVV